MGRSCFYGKNAQILAKENFFIGDNSGIGERSLIDCYGSVTLGNEVMMGPDVLIYSRNHNYSAEGSLVGTGYNCKPVVVKDNVWLGARVIILPGVIIEKGVIVGAGSVVTKNCSKENSIYAGNPAVFKKQR